MKILPLFLAFFLSGTLALLSGCQSEIDQPLAHTNKDSIYTDTLPLSTQVQLYELAYSHYSQLISAVKTEISSRSASVSINPVQFHIAKPTPPKQKIEVKPFWVEEKGEKKQRIDLLCSYQSANCGRLITSLNQILPSLNGGYQFNYFHNPQRYHKFSNQAALAEMCLTSPKQKTAFRQYLWEQQGNLTPNIIRTGLLQRGLSSESIKTCFNNEDIKRQITTSVKELQEQGLSNKISLWINGEYVSVNHWRATLFASLKPLLDISQNKILFTALPANLLNSKQFWLDQNKNNSWVSFAPKSKLRDLRLNHPFVTPDNMMHGWVYEITNEQVVIFNHGKLLTLFKPNQIKTLNPTQTARAPVPSNNLPRKTQTHNQTGETPPSQEKTRQDSEKQWASDEERHQARYEKAVASISAQPLPSSWLDAQLARQQDLEKQLNPTEHEVEGHALLKLDQQNIDGFYQTLGMEPGDVIVRVNDQWIYEGNNPLWDLLQKEERVTVSLIRKGLPVHLAFSKDISQ